MLHQGECDSALPNSQCEQCLEMSCDPPVIKTPQFGYQRELYVKHRDDVGHALLWEMGLGKTKVILDIASYLFNTDKIKSLVVVAPNSCYKNWLGQEAPQHLGAPYIGMPYPKNPGSDKSKYKKQLYLQGDFKPNHLRVLVISYDSIRTLHGFEFVRNVLAVFPSMLVADELTALKHDGTAQSKRMKELKHFAKVRWGLTGTPITNSVFDIHGQIEFIDSEFWAEYGVRSLAAFKREFGVWEKDLVYVGGKPRVFNKFVRPQRIEVLKKLLKKIGSRLLKEDVAKDLPPKIYTTYEFELTKRQREVYEELRTTYMVELDENKIVEAPLALARITRLQQITSGFVRAEHWADGDVKPELVNVIPIDENPRLNLLKDLVEQADHKLIVWARFTRDIEMICETFPTAARYDGKTSAQVREEILGKFRDPDSDLRIIVANTRTISHGVTLIEAKTMIYYSNDFVLEKRLQSEDRAHRIGQTVNVHVIDLVAEGTVDEKIVKSLRDKFDVAASITGDQYREWIKPRGERRYEISARG